MKKQSYASLFTLRKDGRYQGFWRELDREGEPTGKRHTICDRDPARLFRRLQEKQSPPRRTFRTVSEEWEAVHREEVSERTWKNYAPHLSEMVSLYGDVPVSEISAVDIAQDLQASKAKGYSYTIVNSRRSIWNGILDYAVACRDIPYNPAKSVKLPKGLKKGKRHAPSPEMIRTIIHDGEDMEFGFIPFFLLCTGVRRSEALERKKADVNMADWELNIPKSKTEAGIRAVPIIEPLRAPLIRWMESHPGEWLFPHVDYNSHAGGHMSDRNWETAWEKYCADRGWLDETGKPIIGAHHLRHGTATLLYESGVDVYSAQHILGHANVTTTLNIYTDLRKTHERKNIKRFSGKMKKLQKKRP